MICAKVDKIVAAMAKSCLSPKEIAEKAGVSVNIVYRIRRGYLVKIQCFGLVCSALGIEPQDYIDFDRLKAREQSKSGKT